MKQEDIEYFRNLLESQLDDLLKKADTTVNELLNREGAMADPLDRAASDTHHNLNLRIRDRESKLIRKIRNALQSLEDGTFGICEMCEEDIAVNRLKARPVTTLCIQCKTRIEAVERVSGF